MRAKLYNAQKMHGTLSGRKQALKSWELLVLFASPL